MTFGEAVLGTPNLGAAAYRKGLNALDAQDRARLLCASPRKLAGSVALDRTLRSACPDAHRWDYGVAHNQPGEFVYWIEVHPATAGDIRAVLLKLDWLKAWLAADGHRLGALPRGYFWVASGRSSITPGSPQRHRITKAGLQFVGATLRIPFRAPR